MSAWREFTAELARELERAIGEVRVGLRGPEDRIAFRSAPGAWSNLEIAEHVALVDHYLLILADKIAHKAGARLARGQRPGEIPSRLDHLEKLASREFRWSSPEHMLPQGESAAAEIDACLQAQIEHCLRLLEAMPGGEGTLHRIRMSAVGGDDRLDLYQFIGVIALHAGRHARAMHRNAEAFEQRTAS